MTQLKMRIAKILILVLFLSALNGCASPTNNINVATVKNQFEKLSNLTLMPFQFGMLCSLCVDYYLQFNTWPKDIKTIKDYCLSLNSASKKRFFADFAILFGGAEDKMYSDELFQKTINEIFNFYNLKFLTLENKDLLITGTFRIANKNQKVTDFNIKTTAHLNQNEVNFTTFKIETKPYLRFNAVGSINSDAEVRYYKLRKIDYDLIIYKDFFVEEKK